MDAIIQAIEEEEKEQEEEERSKNNQKQKFPAILEMVYKYTKKTHKPVTHFLMVEALFSPDISEEKREEVRHRLYNFIHNTNIVPYNKSSNKQLGFVEEFNVPFKWVGEDKNCLTYLTTTPYNDMLVKLMTNHFVGMAYKHLLDTFKFTNKQFSMKYMTLNNLTNNDDIYEHVGSRVVGDRRAAIREKELPLKIMFDNDNNGIMENS